MNETIPESMNALRLHAPGGVSDLVYERIDTPRPKPGEVLVRVHAAAITRGELEWPADRLPAIPSYEFSGVVVATASDMNDVAMGDEVYALTGFDRDGAAADYTIVRKEVVARKARTLGHIESATIPLAALTAWQALFDHGELRVGQRVLIHGAVGGVGSMGRCSLRMDAVRMSSEPHRRAALTSLGGLGPTRPSITRPCVLKTSRMKSTWCSTLSVERRWSDLLLCSDAAAGSSRSRPNRRKTEPPSAALRPSTSSSNRTEPNSSRLRSWSTITNCSPRSPKSSH
jgi:hypothetical protein